VNKPLVLQDIYLNQARRERIPVNVTMLGGEMIPGYVKGFDSFTVIIEDEESGASQLLYKHAIASVAQCNY